jgi:nicotinamide riboside kinase
MRSTSRSPSEPARRIALIGAESTGKSQLGRELAAHFRALGHRTELVPEVLREWCTREGRAPRPEEQLAIAREQERRVDAAAASAEIVLADTTALMVALYSGMLFKDGELLGYGLERQRSYRPTLLAGLDLPWAPDGLQRESAEVRASVDAQLRGLLAEARIPFRVVYGRGGQRLASALAAIDAALAPPVPGNDRAWSCDKCSDPDCEHRLFTRLL